MMRRHFISVATGIIVVLAMAAGVGTPGLWAADSKTSPAAAQAVSPAGTAVKAAPSAPAGVSKEPAVKAAPTAALPTAAVYEYNATGKPDPFAPFIEMDPILKAKRDEEQRKKMLMTTGRPISPLQQVEIDQFRLVGIAGNDRGRTAIVEDGTAKKHYPLSVGTYIGMNGGRIVSILADRVIIEERLPGQSPKAKKPKVKRMTVMLHKEDEGKP